MERNVLVGIVIIALLVILSVVMYNQFSRLQTQVSLLENQNAELQDQNQTLQIQLKELQLQHKEQQDRSSDITYQLALERRLQVDILEAHFSGWSPIGGVAVIYPANVTIINNDAVSLFGLTATFQFIDKYSGHQIGEQGTTKIERLDVGANQVITGGIITVLDLNMSTGIDNANFKVTVSTGSVILDEWTQELT